MISRLVLVLSVATTAAASDWPQWRGLARDGVGHAIPRTSAWPTDLTRRWRLEVGAGQSSPVVSGSSVFLFSREGEEEVARAVDLETGGLRWRQGYAAPYSVYPGAASYGRGPRSTPVVHDGRLFTLGISGTLTAFDASNGRVLWQKDFAGRFPATSPPFGTAMSPMMAGGRLIVHAGGHEGGALIAFDPASGREVWVLDGDGPSYSSPILASFSGQLQIVVQVHRKVLGVDPASGRLLWSLPFVTPCDQNIVTPLQAGDLLVVSSLDQGTRAIRVTREGQRWNAAVAWSTPEVSMYMSSPILAGGLVVGLSHKKRGQYFALDPATGTVRWKSSGGDGENAALVVMDDAVLSLQGDGRLLVLPAGGAALAPLATYALEAGSTYAHPVPTAAGLLVKGETTLSLFATAPPAGAAPARP